MMENNKFDDTSSSDPAFLMTRCYNFIILFNRGDASCLEP